MSLCISLAQATYELADEIGVEKALSQTVAFMKRNNIEALVPVVKKHLNLLIEKHSANECVHVETPVTLTSDVEADICRAHGVSDVTVQQKMNPSLLAGFIATYKGKSIDTSVRTIINKLSDR